MKYKVDDIVRIIDGKGDYRGCYNGEAHRIKRVLDTAGTRYAVVSGGGLDGFWWFGESEIELVKEAVMEKELEFVGLAIDIEILKEKGACDEGLLWFVKKYGKYYRGSISLTDAEHDQFIKSGIGIKKMVKEMLNALVSPTEKKEIKEEEI